MKLVLWIEVEIEVENVLGEREMEEDKPIG